VVKAADMSEKLQQSAVNVASDALEKWNIEKDVCGSPFLPVLINN
jgi:hypothetical protein